MNLSNMSKKSKSIAVTAFVLGAAMVGVGTVGSTTALADNTSTNPMAEQRTTHINNLVTALAQKFNLNSTEVKTVIDTVMETEKTQMEANRVKNKTDRLAKAVAQGKITQAQANLITAKQQEIKTFMDSLKSKTATERVTAIKTFHESLSKWATDNNIPKQFIGGPEGRMGGKGHGGFGGKMSVRPTESK